ncbi:MAG TPA: hypothetical protein VL354_08095, partial [Spirochaetia bacterium]|nr:hypothetical protein [Spirochaetia bacterium]
FSMYGQMSVRIERLRVVEMAPSFAVKLAKDSIFAKSPAEYSARLADEAETRGDLPAAIGLYKEAGNKDKVAKLSLTAATQASAAKDWKTAAAYYLLAAETPQSLEGLISAYEALGQDRDANTARSRLGELYLGSGELDKALEIFQSSGNTAKTKETYRRMADRSAAAGEYEEARALYEKAGSQAGVAQMEKKLKTLPALPSPGAPALYYEEDGAIVSLSVGAGGKAFLVTDGGALDAATGPKESRRILSDVGTGGWTWPCISALKGGTLALTETNADKKSVLVKVDEAGSRTKLVESANDILAIATDRNGTIYYSTLRTDGSNLTVELNPQHITAAEFICGEIWRLDPNGTSTRVYEGGLPLAMTTDSGGHLYAAIWGKKGAFSAGKGNYSVADPRHIMFICFSKDVQVSRIGEDGAVTVLSDSLSAVSSLAAGSGALYAYGTGEAQAEAGFYSIDFNGKRKASLVVAGKDVSKVTSVAIVPGALYFATVEGKVFKTSLR